MLESIFYPFSPYFGGVCLDLALNTCWGTCPTDFSATGQGLCIFLNVFGSQRSVLLHEAITSVFSIQAEEMKQGCVFRPTDIQGCAWLAAPTSATLSCFAVAAGPAEPLTSEQGCSTPSYQLIPTLFSIPTSLNNFFYHIWEADSLIFFGKRGLLLTRENVQQDQNYAFQERALCVHFWTCKSNWSSVLEAFCTFLLYFCYINLFSSYSTLCTL